MSVCSYVLKGCGFDHKSCLAELVDDSLRACQMSGSEDKQQREALRYHPVLRTPLCPPSRMRDSLPFVGPQPYRWLL